MSESSPPDERPWFSRGAGGGQTLEPMTSRRDATAAALWRKCDACGELLHIPDVNANASVCPRCEHHFPMEWKERIALLVDPGTWAPMDEDLSPRDPLHFFDSKFYADRLVETQARRGLQDAFVAGRAELQGRPIALGTFDFQFMGGSMGSVVGEKVTRLFEMAREERRPAVVISASGGARMQEGILSLMQMAKSTSALARLREAGIPYFSVLTHPTTGGVAASFAMLGDVILAEPKALIGFAGPRVIEQTLRQKLPAGFQRSEYLLGHGMLDAIVSRKELRGTLASLMALLCD